MRSARRTPGLAALASSIDASKSSCSKPCSRLVEFEVAFEWFMWAGLGT